MNELKKKNDFTLLVGILILFLQISEGNTLNEVFQMNIKEKGTEFNETIEIDDTMKTVVYTVPAHNNIKKSDYLVDYKHGSFVTRIPEREVCFIKSFPTVDEPSLRETRKNLKLLQYYKTITKEETVETVEKIMKIIRKIPRDKLSTKIAQFCGNNTAYLVKEEDMAEKYGKSIVKRSNPRVRFYTYSVSTSGKLDSVSKELPNGYLTCKPVEKHSSIIIDCISKGMTPRVGCGLYPISCRYQAYCNVRPESQKKLNVDVDHQYRSDVRQFIEVDIECVEQHKFTSNWCCDAIPC